MKIFKFDVLDSSNEYLKKEHTKYDEYDIILAKNQSNGKARNGNYWVSDEGMALFTFYINKTFSDDIALKVPIITGLSVINALKKVENDKYMFKWTNDVYLDSKKLAGILIENIQEKLYIGIGINVNNKICDELKYVAISMKDKYNKEYDIDELVCKIVEEFQKLLEKTLNNEFGEIIKKVNEINYLKDTNIVVKIFDKLIKAKVLSIDENGFLETISDNKIRKFNVGEIIKEKILLDLDGENIKEKILDLQNKYYDVIGYTKLNSKNINEIAKDTKIKIYQIKSKEDIKTLEDKYKATAL